MRALTILVMVAIVAVGIVGGFRLVTGKDLIGGGNSAQAQPEQQAPKDKAEPPTVVPRPAPLPTPIPTSAPAESSAAPDFKPWWVQNYMETELWSGPDSAAISFGKVPQWSYFLVVAPQNGPRLYVFNPLTQNYAYIDADAVGPSSAPPGSQ